MKWRPIDPAIASKRYGFTNGLIVRSELSSDIALSALSISITTKTDKDKVDAFTLPETKY